MQLFDQMKQAGLDLLQLFHAMILLSHLPNKMFNLTSTIMQTVVIPSFDMETVAGKIVAEMDLQATH